jgi:hypothetical protein
MSKWGQISTPYPAEMVRLVYAMCEHDAFASNVGNYIHDVLHTFFPEMPDVSIPSPSTVKKWLPGLLTLCDVVAALKLLKTKTLTLHVDGTTKRQQKYGINVLHTDDGPVLANGVFTQAGGTGKESAEKVFYCFTNLQDTLTKLVKFFSQQGSARPSFLPSGFDVTKMLVDNKVRIVTQQDHASAQTKQAEEFNTVRDEYASQLGLPPPLPTIDIHCGDHARANVGEAATKAAHKWLESKIGDQKEPNEYGDNILEQLMRMMDLEIGHRSNPYEFGRGVFLFPEWLLKNGLLHAKLLSKLGSRFDSYLENAGRILFLADSVCIYLAQYLLYVKKDGLNKLEEKLLVQLCCVEVRSCLKAMAVFFSVFIQPFRAMSNSSRVGLKFKDMGPMILRGESLLELWSAEPALDDPQALGDLAVCSGQSKFAKCLNQEATEYLQECQNQNPEVMAVVLAESKDTAEWRESFKSMCEGALPVYRRFHKDRLKGGQFFKLSPQQEQALQNSHDTNKLAESGFGVLAQTSTLHRNVSHVVLSARAASKINHPTRSLELLIPDEKERNLIYEFCRFTSGATARSDKKQIQDQLNSKAQQEEATLKKTQASVEQKTLQREVLKLRLHEKASSGEDLKERFQSHCEQLDKTKLSQTRKTQQKMKFLKQERSFLELEGVQKKDLPASPPKKNGGRDRGQLHTGRVRGEACRGVRRCRIR